MQNFFDFLSVLSTCSLGIFVLTFVVALALPSRWSRKCEGPLSVIAAVSLTIAMISPVMVTLASLSNFLF